MPTECRKFFSVPLDQQGKVFSTYSLEMQLDLFRCGLKHRRPPATYLADHIADRGAAAIPVLLEKVETEKDELFQSGLIEVFEVMAEKGYLRNQPQAIKRIREVVAAMKIPTFKETAQEDLEKIEKNAGE